MSRHSSEDAWVYLLTSDALRSELEQRNLSTEGTIPTLRARLLQHLENKRNEMSTAGNPDTPQNPSTLQPPGANDGTPQSPHSHHQGDEAIATNQITNPEIETVPPPLNNVAEEISQPGPSYRNPEDQTPFQPEYRNPVDQTQFRLEYRHPVDPSQFRPEYRHPVDPVQSRHEYRNPINQSPFEANYRYPVDQPPHRPNYRYPGENETPLRFDYSTQPSIPRLSFPARYPPNQNNDAHQNRAPTPLAAYEVLRKWNLKFSGARNEDAEAFLIRIQEGRALINIRDEDILNSIPFFLSGVALYWYRNKRPTWSSFAEFEISWRNRFANPELQFALREEIRKRTQGQNESVSDYLTYMRAYYDRLRPAWSLEEQIDYAYRNLLPYYQVMIRREEIEDLDYLEDVAQRLEISLCSANNYKAPPTPENSLLPELAYRGPRTPARSSRTALTSAFSAFWEILKIPPNPLMPHMCRIRTIDGIPRGRKRTRHPLERRIASRPRATRRPHMLPLTRHLRFRRIIHFYPLTKIYPFKHDQIRAGIVKPPVIVLQIVRNRVRNFVIAADILTSPKPRVRKGARKTYRGAVKTG